MGNLTNVSYGNTGGGVMCFSALYKGKYWIFGATDMTPQAFSIDPMNAVDDEGYPLDECAYELPDVTDFPTWRDVIDAIRENKAYEPYDMGWVERDILIFHDPDKPVNVE